MATPPVRFGIGTYQPIGSTQTLQVASGFPTQPLQLIHPYAGLYGGQYGFLVNTQIRQPNQTTWTPAGEIGLDSLGNSIIRGYPQFTWTYTTMRPDFWYYLNFLYRQSCRTPVGFQYTVLIQYPDPGGTNTPVQALARMEPITASDRAVGAFYGVTLHFTYLNLNTLNPSTPVVVI